MIAVPTPMDAMNAAVRRDTLPASTRFMVMLALMVLFVAAALPVANPFLPRANSDLMAFLGLGLFGLVTCFGLPDAAKTVTVSSLSTLCGFWMLLAGAQFAAGINDGYFSYFLVSVSYLAAVVLLCAWVKMWLFAGHGRWLAKGVMACVLVAGVMEALGVWLQMLGLERWLSPWLVESATFPRQNGFLGQPNLAASLMVCAMVCLVFLEPGAGRSSARPAPWRMLALGWMMMAVQATGSRTGYLEILLLSGAFALARRRLGLSWIWVGLIGWLLLAIGVGELSSSRQVFSKQVLSVPSVESSTVGAISTGSHRVRILQEAWPLIQQHPIMGVGWRRLQVAEVLTPGIDDPVDHTRNLLAQVQVELGLLGTLALLSFVAYWLLAKRPWRQATGDEFAMICIALVLGLHSLLEYPLWQALFLFLFAFAVSVLPGDARRVRVGLPWVKLLCMGMLVCTAWFYLDLHKTLGAFRAVRYPQFLSIEQVMDAHERSWWNRPFLETHWVFDRLEADRALPMMRSIGKERANLFATMNMPLLKVMIHDGETAIANQLARRMCHKFPRAWIQARDHLRSLPEPKYAAWLDQLPANLEVCGN